ncbi:UNVERIFIED_CONTAM: hypothetical protein K2H54_033804 [Gekko kuhli]
MERGTADIKALAPAPNLPTFTSFSSLCLCAKEHNKPLYSFEDNADYVYDVMWSPVHPALFACVDGMGRLDLWNLNNDTEGKLHSFHMQISPVHPLFSKSEHAKCHFLISDVVHMFPFWK